ncbi:MAG: ArsR family transcriptional regulator [Sandaracinus sp.]|nr:ArsR family transcriptional regulator [Sandaracinus sp.]
MVAKGDAEDRLWESELLVSDAIGRLMEFWGFKRNMGRVWTVLFLSDEPLSAKQLQNRLQLSSGAVSMTVNELARWGVVKKVWVQGERKDFFVAEGNLWKMISRVFNERERVEILDAIDAMEEALDYARRKQDATPEGAVRQRAQLQLERIGQLLELARLGQRLLEALLRRGRVDISPLLEVLLGQSLGSADDEPV